MVQTGIVPHVLRRTVFSRAGRYGLLAAGALMLAGCKTKQKTAGDLYLEGEMLMKQQNYGEAIARFKEAQAKNPPYPGALLRECDALHALGKNTESEKCSEKYRKLTGGKKPKPDASAPKPPVEPPPAPTVKKPLPEKYVKCEYPVFLGQSYAEGRTKAGEAAVRLFQESGVALIKFQPKPEIERSWRVPTKDKEIWMVSDLTRGEDAKKNFVGYAFIEPVSAYLTPASLAKTSLGTGQEEVQEAWTIMCPAKAHNIEGPLNRDWNTWLVDAKLGIQAVIRDGVKFYILRAPTAEEKAKIDMARKKAGQLAPSGAVFPTIQTDRVWARHVYDPATREVGAFQAIEIY